MLLSLLLAAAAAAAVEATNLRSDPTILTADDVLYKPYSALLMGLMGGETGREGLLESNSTWAPEVWLALDGSLDFSSWDEAANTACTSHLKSLSRHSSSSGHSVCYNLAMLDAETGKFTADVRLYQVSELKGGFEGVPPGEIQVGAAYRGANASVMQEHSDDVTKRAASIADGPILLQSHKLSGQIDTAKLENISMAHLQAIVLPDIKLTAKSSSGEEINSTISANEASFVVGIFSKATVLSQWAMAQAAVNDQLAALHNGTISFIVPGRHIMIFPIGAIITGAWLLIGLVT
ncbi:hypothetical protein ESCO_002098 [Escovopsis weberi]|uniref:Uncharacterized protein n=1 Tax=Escovopsis weberi TaxID=150374 RepID=A0A0M8N857_ESCWE|nr:hypothetical protein ESCO_002098 [Escovopsis weberi]